MTKTISCPICGSIHDGHATQFVTNRDSIGYDCTVCGPYEVSGSVQPGTINPKIASLNPIERAFMSHLIRRRAQEGQTPLITTEWVKKAREDARLPSPSLQALNLIRVIGDHVLRTGQPYPPGAPAPAIVGSANRQAFYRLLHQLTDRNLILKAGEATMANPDGGTIRSSTYDLTLEGWEKYESERRGQTAGTYGFLAMKFGDEVLDKFVNDVVKPTVRDCLCYDLFDMRDVAKAGLIDNIMRAKIRDAAFVIVDLTHDNSGAYWEAGFAEGLGKPVIYICERKKFEQAKTHFDTNHCTTVCWSENNAEEFSRELIATLRRSLNLF